MSQDEQPQLPFQSADADTDPSSVGLETRSLFSWLSPDIFGQVLKHMPLFPQERSGESWFYEKHKQVRATSVSEGSSPASPTASQAHTAKCDETAVELIFLTANDHGRGLNLNCLRACGMESRVLTVTSTMEGQFLYSILTICQMPPQRTWCCPWPACTGGTFCWLARLATCERRSTSSVYILALDSLQPMKSSVFWPVMDRDKLQVLNDIFPLAFQDVPFTSFRF